MTTAQTISVKVLFFGAAKDLAGTNEKMFGLPENISAAEAFTFILQSIPTVREKFGKSLLFAVNQSYVTGEETIKEGDELAIFPPVSGGSGKEITNAELRITNSDFFEITDKPLDVGAIARRVCQPKCGATV
ncbi:MAG: molybdopterin converting factor subunit 1, partial [Pyrinomonadaceae bacterium]